MSVTSSHSNRIDEVLHLQPMAQINGFLGISMFTQSLDKQFRALVDVFFRLKHIAKRINRVHDSTVVAMHPFVNASKSVRLLANRRTSPNRIEISLRKRPLVPIDLGDGGGFSSRDLIWSNADENAIFLMEIPLHFLHVTDIDAVHIP